MIITISGKPGSGKSTAAKLLAARLGYQHYSIGDIKRKWAEERGMTIAEYNALEEKDPQSDNRADEYLAELGRKEDNFVIDARLGFHFIAHSIKIFLDVSEDEGAKRIMGDKRSLEPIRNHQEAIALYRKRQNSDRKRYMTYYKIDPFTLSHYDLVINTSEKRPDEVVGELEAFVRKRIL